MSLVHRIKSRAGRYFLRKEGEIKRHRKGSNFKTAAHVAILYKDQDEDFYRQIKSYVKYLHEEHGIRKVFALGFVDTQVKKVPVWHTHKLEMDYFTREDLNWHLKPSQVLQTFCEKEFDILIDLTTEDSVPLNYLLAYSSAKMKVGRRGSAHEEQCDLLIDLGKSSSLDKFIDQVNFYLSNFKIQ